MNGFHVHAVGWLLTVSAFSLKLKPPEASELSHLWEDLVRARAEDLARASLVARLLAPRSIPLSEPTIKALIVLLERMAARHPERFGVAALRTRRNSWTLQAALGFASCGLVRTLLPEAWPLVDAVVPALFLMGCMALVAAVTLWRSAAAAHYCSTLRQAPTTALHGVARRL